MRACPKPEKRKLAQKEILAQREALHERSGGICEGCGKHLPVYVYDYEGNKIFDLFRCGTRSHIKSMGSGGSNDLDNLMWHCFTCHREWEDHTGKYKNR